MLIIGIIYIIVLLTIYKGEPKEIERLIAIILISIIIYYILIIITLNSEEPIGLLGGLLKRVEWKERLIILTYIIGLLIIIMN